MKVVAWDTETFPIGNDYGPVPPMVCLSTATRVKDELHTQLVGVVDNAEEIIRTMLMKCFVGSIRLVTHNGGFDYAVVCRTFPDLIPLVFDTLQSGNATDTLWREKLLNLSDTGRLEDMQLPDGSSKQISYSLAAMVLEYLGLDISATKEGEDVWRMNYEALDGMSATEYPEDAARYAVDDAAYTLQVYEHQEVRLSSNPDLFVTTEEFQLASSFALTLMGAWGMAVDPAAVDEMEHRLDELVPDFKLTKLIEAGILQPAVPARIQTRGGKPVLDRKAMEEQGRGEDNPIYKVTAEKPAKLNLKAGLQPHLRALYKRLGEIPDYTDSTVEALKENPDLPEDERTIKCDADVHEYLAMHDEIMAEYHLRESVKKVREQIPVFRYALEHGHGVVHPSYDALVSTSRTSCFDGGKRKGQERILASRNIQNVPNVIEAPGGEEFDTRRCYRPRSDRVFFDSDFTNLELACVGQMTYSLFGRSMHRDLYNAGWDLHAFLGSQIVIRSATEGFAKDFVRACDAEGVLQPALHGTTIGDLEPLYRAFLGCKKHDEEDARKFYKHFRTLAKPVGLGYPGGLGAAKLVKLAWSTYRVRMTLEQAEMLREVWFQVYPEMRMYFDWVPNQLDDRNIGEDGRPMLFYETPMGMIRRGATYCAVANGKAMQSPAAEGAKLACLAIQRECYDPTSQSILYGCRPIAFVHDQVIGETTEDESIWHEQAMRIRELMVGNMQIVLPDMKVRSDETLLTKVWTKEAEPVYVDGRLVPWEPKETKAA